jgi:hypothetical protein
MQNWLQQGKVKGPFDHPKGKMMGCFGLQQKKEGFEDLLVYRRKHRGCAKQNRFLKADRTKIKKETGF